MKVLLKLFLSLVAASLSANSYAFPEIPFCPAGGPPGWMNHFNNKRDHNTWHHYSQYASPAYNRPNYNGPGYGYGYMPAYRPAHNNSYSQQRAAPFRND